MLADVAADHSSSDMVKAYRNKGYVMVAVLLKKSDGFYVVPVVGSHSMEDLGPHETIESADATAAFVCDGELLPTTDSSGVIEFWDNETAKARGFTGCDHGNK